VILLSDFSKVAACFGLPQANTSILMALVLDVYAVDFLISLLFSALDPLGPLHFLIHLFRDI
jgi:hypothetical protein